MKIQVVHRRTLLASREWRRTWTEPVWWGVCLSPVLVKSWSADNSLTRCCAVPSVAMAAIGASLPRRQCRFHTDGNYRGRQHAVRSYAGTAAIAGPGARAGAGPIAERAAEIDRTEQYPWDNVALLKEAGFFGMTIPAAYGGRRRLLSRRRAGHRGDGEMLRHHRPHRRRGQYGRDRRDHGIRQRGAEAARRRPRAVRRQAGDLHHRAGRRQRRERDDDARRPARQRLRRQRPQALDHRRRRLAPAPGLRPRVRRAGRGRGHRRLHRDPRRDARASRSARASRRWGCAASPRPRSSSRTWS